MNKKYFFFDIDGTLTDKSTGKIVPSAQVALNELQKAGHFVAIATGRAHYKARNFMESVFSALAGWLILHQTLTPTELTGCALMFAAIVASQLPEKKRVQS